MIDNHSFSNHSINDNKISFTKRILVLINHYALLFIKNFITLMLNFDHPSFLNPFHHILSFFLFFIIILPLWLTLNIFNFVFINIFIIKNYLLTLLILIIYFIYLNFK